MQQPRPLLFMSVGSTTSSCGHQRYPKHLILSMRAGKHVADSLRATGQEARERSRLQWLQECTMEHDWKLQQKQTWTCADTPAAMWRAGT